MLIAFEGGRLELRDAQPNKLRHAVERIHGLQALSREFEEFVKTSKQTLALSKNLRASLARAAAAKLTES